MKFKSKYRINKRILKQFKKTLDNDLSLCYTIFTT